MKRISILVCGAGAIGCYYGSKLHQGGAQVSFVTPGDTHLLQDTGIYIESLNEKPYHFFPYEVINPGQTLSHTPDYVIVTTKVLPHIDTVEVVRPYLNPHTTIVLLQNGIDIEHPFSQAFPNHELIRILAFVCVSRQSIGNVLHQDYGKIAMGNYPKGTSSRAQQLAQSFEKGGVECELSDQVQLACWKKLSWNAAFNPVSVLARGADTKTMLNDPECRQLIESIMGEVVSIAAHTGYDLPSSLIEEQLKNTDAMVPYKTSMLLDYENGRPMEIDAIVGNALRVARRHNVPAPRLQSLYGLLRLY
ncbi:ketopantoate reductase family protein [Desulfurispira natronophila]|uniref:2-dehydropantoate 2-reductase n=1 Tax=Desulfurispira natronophila TaxID=682562 RepID=A0A7W8DFW6_9BACT|nr:2-dehydropantoate 2-reductase [Desulfurispira natronophila]MBB5020866.1 2-dehydropantoate 2-reductase [Desulfurispira natronophila]